MPFRFTSWNRNSHVMVLLSIVSVWQTGGSVWGKNISPYCMTYLHQLLYSYHVIQADETPVLVNKDGQPAGCKSYMWAYRSGYMYPDRQIILYEYQRTRNASHPRTFLKDYFGIVSAKYQGVPNTFALTPATDVRVISILL